MEQRIEEIEGNSSGLVSKGAHVLWIVLYACMCVCVYYVHMYVCTDVRTYVCLYVLRTYICM
jgi:hypothetical protein